MEMGVLFFVILVVVVITAIVAAATSKPRRRVEPGPRACSLCGTLSPAHANYCPRCGRRIA